MNLKKRILVAPLNWGLGHAARCIPIIASLKAKGFEPIIASDGEAFQLLIMEYPELDAVSLPSYHIRYPKNGNFLKWKLLLNSPKILRAIKAEKKLIETLVSSQKIDGIISDNRLGVHHKSVPSVFITHQLKVLSGQTTWISSKIHEKYIKTFDACWVPDMAAEPNLSGALGHVEKYPLPIKYLGIISRFRFTPRAKKYDLLVLLSGPEPQRSLLETILLKQLRAFQGSVLLVQGKMEPTQIKKEVSNIRIVNFMLSDELEKTILESQLVLARSGYTSLMDLAKLKARAFFIPTPGQFEQIYLAQLMNDQKIAPYCNQKDFSVTHLQKVKNYSGFEHFEASTHMKELLSFFEGK